MRIALACLCALAAAASTAQAAGRAKHITLKVGDEFLVAGTTLACQTQVGRHLMVGQKLVTCFKFDPKGLAPKSYITALAANGQVVVAPIKANRTPGNPVFSRKPASLGAAAKRYTVKAGDELILGGTNLGCAINNDSSGVYPACFRLKGGNAVPNSYGFAETDKFAAVVKFNGSGKSPKLVFKRQHGQ